MLTMQSTTNSGLRATTRRGARSSSPGPVLVSLSQALLRLQNPSLPRRSSNVRSPRAQLPPRTCAATPRTSRTCITKVQVRRITTGTRPNFLVHRSCWIKIRQYFFQLAPDVRLNSGYRSGTFDLTPLRSSAIAKLSSRLLALNTGCLHPGTLRLTISAMWLKMSNTRITPSPLVCARRVRHQGDGR